MATKLHGCGFNDTRLANQMNSRSGLAFALPLFLGAAALPAYSQENGPPPPPSNGWHRLGEARQADNQPPAPQPYDSEAPVQRRYDSQGPASQPNGSRPYDSQPNGSQPHDSQPYDSQRDGQRPYDRQSQGQRPYDGPPPSQLSLAAGSWITVRVNQPLSSDHNQPGDSFTATLVQPMVANGFVLARRGQTVGGRVAEAIKAGHVKGTSRLGLQLTELSLVDGQQVPLRTQLVDRRGETSIGRDVAAVGTTTGIGAAIGAAADGGFGAGMGAIAGAGASIIGVLATRGRATEVYPETVLTFRLEAPIVISTERSGQAFQPVGQEDYEQRNLDRQRPRMAPRPSLYGGGSYGPGYYGAAYYPPFFYGPSFFFSSGPGFYGRGFYGRGFYGRGYGRRW